MAEPTAGTYLIISCVSSKALDVKGASDTSGANVQQWNVNRSDAQIWALMKPEGGGWQVTCSLSGKCLDVKGGSATSGANVQQWNDNNSRAQRWAINTDGKTFNYGGTNYPSYTFKPYTNTGLAMDVHGGKSNPGENVWVYKNNNSNAQRWILVPINVFKQNGTYELVLASDPSMCVEVASSSTANSANLQVGAISDSNNQIFRTIINSENFLVRFANANSSKLIDVKSGGTTNGTNIQQYVANGTASQNWLPVQNGSVKIAGSNVPTYELRAQVGSSMCMDCQGGGKTAKTNIQLYTRNNSVAQRFAFVKTEMYAPGLTMPGAITSTNFVRDGAGGISISGLRFQSGYNMFQCRYKVRTYGITKDRYSDTNWMNLATGSTARSGWGDAWAKTFTASPSGGMVTLPFSKTYNLTANNPWVDITFEVRVFSTNYNGFIAHGPVRSTTIHLGIRPSISMNALKMSADTANDSIYITASASMIAGGYCQYFRGQLIGSDGRPMSEVRSSSNLSLNFSLFDESLYRLPNHGERIGLRYTLVSTYNSIANGTQYAVFNYTGSGVTVNPSLSYPKDDSDSVIVSSHRNAADFCMMVVDDIDKTKVIKCSQMPNSTSSIRRWRIVPPLNKTVKLVLIGSSAITGGAWLRKEITCRVNSHQFIWNWTEYESNDPLAQFASVIVNSDNPPAQTRQFDTDLTLLSPAGRLHPVGFSGKGVGIDLSIEGIIVDPDANYVSHRALPKHSTIDYIKKLIRLSADGIHPIYRTPYGDWYQVGIESVDISKTELQKSAIKVTQHALED